jgi:Tol biopolymer transport system component
LVIGTVVGDPVIVVRDIQDPANAKNLCTTDAGAQSPQFVSASAVAYETADVKIIKADLATGATTILAAGSGQYAISPDGRSISYLYGNAWHLAGSSGDRVLTTLPPVPARGGGSEDDSYLSFSPDGKYLALFQTGHTGGTGETAPDQIRRASDGGLVYSTTGMTMAVWASIPSRLYFRDLNGSTVRRWDSSTGVSSTLSLQWLHPRSSPDGRWIAYTVRTTSGLGAVGLYSVQGNSFSNATASGRSGVKFLTNDLVFYIGERACSSCIGPEPTGQTYIYSIASASEVISRLSSVFDAWPRFTAPGVG